MIQIIGLIIGVYCMYRMVQLPLSMAAFEGTKFLGMDGKARLQLVCIGSALTLFILGYLTMMLLGSGLADG